MRSPVGMGMREHIHPCVHAHLLACSFAPLYTRFPVYLRAGT